MNNKTFETTIYKPMEYSFPKSTNYDGILLAEGWLDKQKSKIKYRFHWLVVSYLTHPCVYIALPRRYKWYGKHYDNILSLNVHGGLTYASKGFPRNFKRMKDIWVIGWDYAHSGDYLGLYDLPELKKKYPNQEKKWTTEELVKEVQEALKQI